MKLKNIRTTTILLGLLAILPLLQPALGHADDEGGPRDGAGRIERLTEELDLSKAQVKQLKAINEKYKDTMKTERQAVKAATKDLNETLRSAAGDAEVRAKFEALQAAGQKAAELRFEKVMAVRAILTQEQRAKFKGMKMWGGPRQKQRG